MGARRPSQTGGAEASLAAGGPVELASFLQRRARHRLEDELAYLVALVDLERLARVRVQQDDSWVG
jgi:hypothetical protein